MVTDEATIQHLTYLVRTYDAITKTGAATKNRVKHLNKEADPKNIDIIKNMKAIKDKLSRRIEKELEYWDIWTAWLKGVPGIGPAIGSKLILLYYYRFIPVCSKCGGDLIKKDGLICSECGKKAKGEGILDNRLEFKFFPKVSSWWKYMGVHCDPKTGRKPLMRKGAKVDWNVKGRALNYQIGEQFIKKQEGSGHQYRAYYDMRRALRDKTHPKATKKHRNNMARNEVGKFFLCHFIQVAKELAGEEFTKPYQHTVMGHTNFIEPFYWEPNSA